VDIGSSFLPSEIIAAFLYAQLENIEKIQTKRGEIWDYYYQGLSELEEKGCILLPVIRDYSTNNAHMFYLLCSSVHERTELILHLKKEGIHAVFHYQSLHKSSYYQQKHTGSILSNADRYTDTLLRLPLFYELKIEQIQYIIENIKTFYLK
jgi:dTDP-4-amino-4,6-dideoxygalactose transaminase